MSIRLYLDDVRNPPDDGGGPWTVCRTLDEAKALLLRGVDEVSCLRLEEMGLLRGVCAGGDQRPYTYKPTVEGQRWVERRDKEAT